MSRGDALLHTSWRPVLRTPKMNSGSSTSLRSGMPAMPPPFSHTSSMTSSTRLLMHHRVRPSTLSASSTGWKPRPGWPYGWGRIRQTNIHARPILTSNMRRSSSCSAPNWPFAGPSGPYAPLMTNESSSRCPPLSCAVHGRGGTSMGALRGWRPSRNSLDRWSACCTFGSHSIAPCERFVFGSKILDALNAGTSSNDPGAFPGMLHIAVSMSSLIRSPPIWWNCEKTKPTRSHRPHKPCRAFPPSTARP